MPAPDLRTPSAAQLLPVDEFMTAKATKLSAPPRSADPATTIIVDPFQDPISSAELVGLRHVSDAAAGIQRCRCGNRFIYKDADGRRVRGGVHLARIHALVIPPAWREVWICPVPNGHLQATGRDARGRKQYRYHPRYRAVRDETKYDRMIAFGRALPLIRRRVQHDLGLPGLPREKVLATVVRLLEITRARVGNEEYARSNGSYGLTTLRNHHATVGREQIHLAFRGKSARRIRIDVEDRRLAKIVKRCRDLPGQELFQYLDDGGARRPINSADVNDYLREATGLDFTAKDFRTWSGTVLAARALRSSGPCPEGKGSANAKVVAAIDWVAAELNNTRSVCRRCYVHPAVIDAYLNGTLSGGDGECASRRQTAPKIGLAREEKELLRLLRARKRRDRLKPRKLSRVAS
jgi:DNA topoisomerase-1